MPVTIFPARHKAEAIDQIQPLAKSPQDLLERSCRERGQECAELLQSSFGPDLNRTICPSSNGFVYGAITAYNKHHHLKVRPEDIWFSVLSQLSLYINAHAEELRSMFVAHEDKKELVLHYGATRYSMDFGLFAEQMGQMIEENILDPELREWMMPAFSTTTKNDTIVASILLMGAMQAYFDFKCVLSCGLPSVTILGERADWVLVLQRLEKLKTFGKEPTLFYTLLKPIIKRFIESFDDPSSEETISFLATHCTLSRRRQRAIGKCMYAPPRKTDHHGFDVDNEDTYDENAVYPWQQRANPALKLDDAVYHRIERGDVPLGYSTVPIKVDDHGIEFPAVMVAGSVGVGCSASTGDENHLDTIQPETGWPVYEKKSGAVQPEAGWSRNEKKPEAETALPWWGARLYRSATRKANQCIGKGR